MTEDSDIYSHRCLTCRAFMHAEEHCPFDPRDPHFCSILCAKQYAREIENEIKADYEPED